ncbi:flagellar hook assembly protein FlgD [Borrelia miyamotoi]|uniref:Basal-body rod modification protein FlgD n=1 Tax=Borrelia miyamotoi TaxID=47466 RepID=A0AAP8YW30_9SPIR|nr:flagellar hook assembly protein FlgD [Borrelia miyamotoi]AHH05130.1 Basal-body rod modification protein flgD [Borrelia miyamotoi FR64b]ATQ14919.1 flagellar hook assembly protein FlgD [Borrelia miyamotoi]ATQ16102.1 flagellar hook assembly protein FlgD [Borrelia miyamotoi]ATQ17247.1 flagellar hook assembly protein FlgD [Borrelia miyamotoi]ATQ18247.1 flagellar hook assembly protein FlgD [Borrelia miyamotoi]
MSTIGNLASVNRVKTMSNSNGERDIKGSNLGRDDFLKLLITQLKYQDPTDPMKDKEFIAQMAQFSALEQMTNMSKSFESLSSALDKNKDLGLLGKIVEFENVDGEIVKGKVTNIKMGVVPQIMIDGKYYVYDNILSVGLEG